MITIVEPKDHIARLWGKQQIRESDTYRLMRYVLRVDHEGKVLLHNVVTGQLVVLEQEEADALDKLPSGYNPAMEQLVSGHYLVPEGFDEHQQVVNLRIILRRLDDARQSKSIDHCTILPTTACNARCYYCFEQGIKPITMTEQTANDVVDFLAKHCNKEKTILISWFGGEPTVAAHRIDQISEGLLAKGIDFQADMTTNAYLFDEAMVERAKSLWHLKHVMMCVDGAEENYNKIKAYVNAQDNPYRRIMRNIGLFLENEIHVTVRMNFDLENYTDFPRFVEEAHARFGSHPLLEIFTHPVNGEYPNREGRIIHASDAWFDDKIPELNNHAKSFGFLGRNSTLPFLHFHGCKAAIDSYTVINADGALSRCPECMGEKEITGNVWEGTSDLTLVQQWKEFADYQKCINCVLYPLCVKMINCPAQDRCYSHSELSSQCKSDIIREYNHFNSEEV